MRRKLVGILIVGLVPMMTTSGSLAAPSAPKPFPLDISFKLVPAPASAKFRSVNVHLNNTSRKMSGGYFFALNTIGHRSTVTFPRGYEKAWRNGVNHQMLGSNPGIPPGKSIYMQVKFSAADFRKGVRITATAWLRFSSDTRQVTKQEKWNIDY